MGVLKTTVLVSGVIAIWIASMLNARFQKRNFKDLSAEDKWKVESITCGQFDSWLALVSLAPFVLFLPLMVYLGPDHSQTVGLLFIGSYFVGNVVNNIGFMNRRVRALASLGLADSFVESERNRMVWNAWLEPAAWTTFLFVIVLPLGA